MIAFVEAKRPDYGRIERLLGPSQASGVWSNFGPLSLRLEERVAGILGTPSDRRVVVCSNGAVALHALVRLHEHVTGRPLRWVVSAFTFHAQRQGPLAAAQVLDCNADGFLDLAALEALPPESYDGFVVTNLFGVARDVELYESFARRSGKIVLFDSATCLGSLYRGRPIGNAGAGEIFSFHHTKPCGFGEGGCVVLPAALEDTFRSLINFGLYKGIDTGAVSCNGKMSDVAAAFILDRLQGWEAHRAEYSGQFRRLAGVAAGLGLSLLVDGGEEGVFPSLAAVLMESPCELERAAGGPMVVHKYYRPLESRPRADALYRRVVCFPCHRGVAELGDDQLNAALTALRR